MIFCCHYQGRGGWFRGRILEVSNTALTLKDDKLPCLFRRSLNKGTSVNVNQNPGNW